MGKFRVKGTFALPSESQFVLVGDVIEEVVAAGMFVRVPLSSTATYVAPIEAVEVVLGTAGNELGLCIGALEGEQQFWRGLGVEGEVLEVSEAGPRQGVA